MSSCVGIKFLFEFPNSLPTSSGNRICRWYAFRRYSIRLASSRARTGKGPLLETQTFFIRLRHRWSSGRPSASRVSSAVRIRHAAHLARPSHVRGFQRALRSQPRRQMDFAHLCGRQPNPSPFARGNFRRCLIARRLARFRARRLVRHATSSPRHRGRQARLVRASAFWLHRVVPSHRRPRPSAAPMAFISPISLRFPRAANCLRPRTSISARNPPRPMRIAWRSAALSSAPNFLLTPKLSTFSPARKAALPRSPPSLSAPCKSSNSPAILTPGPFPDRSLRSLPTANR